MSKLQGLVRQHCAERGLSTNELAARTGLSYPAARALLRKGALPRSDESRDRLRRELNLEPEAWKSLVAAERMGVDEVPAAEDDAPSLQQLVVRALIEHGFTEQSFAKATGIPYPTLMGITRKGAIPRAGTLAEIAERLQLDLAAVQAAANRSREERADAEPAAAPRPAVVYAAPVHQEATHLAQATMDAIAASGDSVATWAQEHEVPYLSLTRLLYGGLVPRQRPIIDAIEKAIDVGDRFAKLLDASRANPTPATPPAKEDDPVTPLQAALRKLVDERKLTVKAFAEAADLSVLTATRLLKRGELPGRTTTNNKLRALLELSVDAYEDLLARSRAIAGVVVASDDDEHPPANAPATAASATGADEDLHALIDRLNPRQREAVRKFILTLH